MASDTATDASTATPTAESVDRNASDGGQNASTPAGADLDPTRLNAATAAAVEEAGSFTVRTRARTVGQSARGRTVSLSNSTTRVDLDSSQGIRSSNRSSVGLPFGQNATTVVYTANGTSYRQQTTSDGVNYSTQQGTGAFRPVSVSSFNGNFALLTRGLVWTENGTRTIDGVTATRYTLRSVAESGDPDAPAVTDARGTLLVDDGVVRAAGYSIATASQRGSARTTFSYRLTDVGSTTVTEPDWTSEAAQSA